MKLGPITPWGIKRRLTPIDRAQTIKLKVKITECL